MNQLRWCESFFSEPHFEPRPVKTIIAENGAKTGTIDPVGVSFHAGQVSCFLLFRNMPNNLLERLLSLGSLCPLGTPSLGTWNPWLFLAAGGRRATIIGLLAYPLPSVCW